MSKSRLHFSQVATDSSLPTEEGTSPVSFADGEPQYTYAYNDSGRLQYDEDLHVPCPPHTTERKLVAKIDLRVIPFLCILYLLAFLDRYVISHFSCSCHQRVNSEMSRAARDEIRYIRCQEPSNKIETECLKFDISH